MPSSTADLVARAKQLASSGHWDEAERVWHEVRTREPENPQALFSLGVHALKRGDAEAARKLLEAARSVAPADLLVLMTLCAACRHQGDAEAERQAIEAALVIDAYFLPALLAKGSWLERFGSATGAATTFANALKIAPAPTQWPASLRSQLEHARSVVDRYSNAFESHLGRELEARLAALPPASAERWHEAASIMARKTEPYRSVCNQLTVPRLPAIPFFDRADFPFLPDLEAKTDEIRAEMLAAFDLSPESFTPYIQYGTGEPVNQWTELNHSRRWSTFHLLRNGKPVVENLARCPVTSAALDALPKAEIAGLCPNAMFSVLAAHTHIPPHNGETNARVIAHLPLVVPTGCVYRVGFERRNWRVGETLIFDDTIEHEARNDSDEIRVVLIFDLWNPLLTNSDREMVNALAAAARAFI